MLVCVRVCCLVGRMGRGRIEEGEGWFWRFRVCEVLVWGDLRWSFLYPAALQCEACRVYVGGIGRFVLGSLCTLKISSTCSVVLPPSFLGLWRPCGENMQRHVDLPASSQKLYTSRSINLANRYRNLTSSSWTDCGLELILHVPCVPEEVGNDVSAQDLLDSSRPASDTVVYFPFLQTTLTPDTVHSWTYDAAYNSNRVVCPHLIASYNRTEQRRHIRSTRFQYRQLRRDVCFWIWRARIVTAVIERVF